MTSTAAQTRPAPIPATLERRLGPLDAAAIVVSNVIGGGIFFVPILVASDVPQRAGPCSPCGSLGGLLAFAGAMAYAELAALRPRAGGEYVYLRDGVRPAGRVPHRLDVVRRRILGRDCRQRRGARRLHRPLRARPAPSTTPLLTIPIPLRAAGRSPARRSSRIGAIVALSFVHLHGVGPAVVHNLLAGSRSRRCWSSSPSVCRSGDGSYANVASTHVVPAPCTGWLLALDSRDVHLLGLERGGLRGRGDPRSGPQRAAGARTRHAGGRRHLPRAERRSISTRCRSPTWRPLDGRADRHRRRSPVRIRGRQPAGDLHDRQHRGQHQRDGAGRAARLLRDGARPASSWRRPAACIPRYKTPVLAIVAQAVWSSLLVLGRGRWRNS